MSLGPGTRPSLLKAISHLDEALRLEPLPNVRVNLARVLLMQGRWIESADEFNLVLQEQPDHHNALALRGSSFIGIYNWTSEHMGLLIAALADHERAEDLALGDLVSLRSYSTVIADLRARGISSYEPSLKEATHDQQWIWEKRLALNPCPLCRAESPDAFDLYPLAARLEGGRRKPSVEDSIEMVNALCRSFATARWSLYKATQDNPSESDHVITLRVDGGSRHDLRVGLAMVALSSFYSVLGQIAYGINAYFDLGHRPNHVTFETVWHPTGKKARGISTTRKELHPKLTRYPCSALSALHALALSMEISKGQYEQLRKLRNRIEHRIVVPRHEPVESPCFEAVEPAALESAALRMGRIAKAAIWYFGGAILRGEQARLRRALKRGHRVWKGKGPSVDRS